MKHIYLAGKISDPSPAQMFRNREGFNKKAKTLRELGHKVFNPVENEDEDPIWSDALARDVHYIYTQNPDTFYFMKRWTQSEGAKLEHAIALVRKAKIIYE